MCLSLYSPPTCMMVSSDDTILLVYIKLGALTHVHIIMVNGMNIPSISHTCIIIYTYMYNHLHTWEASRVTPLGREQM